MNEQVNQNPADQAGETVKNAVDTLSAALNKGAELVRKHPVESVLAGFGFGCLIGVLLSRRD